MDIYIVGKKEDGWRDRTRQNDSGKDEKRYKDLEILLARELVLVWGVFICILSDNAYKCDPRVEKFLAQQQEEKAAKRRAKEEAVRKKEQVKNLPT